MAQKQSHKESVPPTLTPARAIELLRQQLSQIDQIQQMPYNAPEIKTWALTTENILHGAFGKPDGEDHKNTREFVHASGGSVRMGMSPSELERYHQRQTRTRKAVLESIIQQLEILAPSATQADSHSSQSVQPRRNNLEIVKVICLRFHQVARQLRDRHDGRPTLEITDEYDVQDLLHALLCLHYDDIRPEEYAPSYGGGASRMDFLLKNEQIVVEAKMTRANLKAREVSDQLTIDAARYKGHPDCKSLVCLVYDPVGFIGNPRGVENDLARLSAETLQVIAMIIPK